MEQGITLPTPSMTAPAPLPAAMARPQELLTGTSEEHQFNLPTNAAGAAKTARRPRTILPNQPTTVLPSFSLSATPFPPGAVLFSPQSTTTHVPQPQGIPAAEPQVPSSTMSYRRKRLQKELEGNVQRKRYNRKDGTTCKQCGKERLADNHRQYYGNWWCREKSDKIFEEWVENLKEQGKGKRRKTNE